MNRNLGNRFTSMIKVKASKVKNKTSDIFNSGVKRKSSVNKIIDDCDYELENRRHQYSLKTNYKL